MRIILLAMFPLFLFASLEKTQKYYDNGEYKQAITEARISKSEYNKPQLHLLWAKSAKKLGHLDEAMSAYERVVMLDEMNVDAKFELAKIYDETSRISLAKETTKELSNYQLTPEQRSALELIAGADIQKIKAKASLTFGHDNNINVSAKADKLDNFYQVSNSTGEQSSLFARFNGSVSYINDFDDEDGAYLRGDLKLYYQNNSDAHYYDMFIGTLNTGFGYRSGGYNVFAPIGIDKITYLETSLMQQYKFEPRVEININNRHILNINGSYKQRVYNDSKYEIMNDSSFGIGIGLYYLMDKDFVYYNAKYEMFSSEESVHALYIDKDILTLSLGINYNLSSWLVTKLDYKYRNASYDDNRDDDYHQGEIKFSHYLFDKYELFISNKYIKNSSDYVPANYTKNMAVLGLSVSY